MSRTTTKKIEVTDEMVDDLQSMSYADFCVKWNVSTRICKQITKEYGIETYYSQNGNRPHKIVDGVEYKWCGRGHWETLDKFGKTKARWDGLRWTCLEHSREDSKTYIYSRPIEARKAKVRKDNFARRSNYIHWTPKDQRYIYDLFEGHCAYCGCPVDRELVEFDHFIPLKHGGTTHPSNILPACTRCNRGIGGKMSKMPLNWMKSYFGESRGIEIYNNCVGILSQFTEE